MNKQKEKTITKKKKKIRLMDDVHFPVEMINDNDDVITIFSADSQFVLCKHASTNHFRFPNGPIISFIC